MKFNRMKIVLIILFSVSIYAQDSNFVGTQKINSPDNLIPMKKNPNKHSLIKIVPLRYWKLDIDNNKNSKVDYTFNIKVKKRDESFIEDDLFYVVIGTAIVLGGTAAYCKNQSDRYYKKFQQSGNSKYLTKSNNYDLYAGMAIGGLQINFGYMLYRFLTER